MSDQIETKGSDVAGENDIPIESGCSNIGSVSDQFLVVDLGRDIEIAALKFGPRLRFKRVPETDEDDERGAIKIDNVIVETARVRTSPKVASFLAMDILYTLAKRGGVDLDALEENLKSIREAARKADEEGIGDDYE